MRTGAAIGTNQARNGLFLAAALAFWQGPTGCGAQAGGGEPGGGDQGQPTTTAPPSLRSVPIDGPTEDLIRPLLKNLTPEDIELVCSASMVFIGTISQVDSFVDEDTPVNGDHREELARGMIYSHVVFEVERAIRGMEHGRFEIIMYGGKIGDRWTSFSERPRPRVGLRYFMAISPIDRKQRRFFPRHTDFFYHRFALLRADIELPPEEMMRLAIDDVCP